MSEIIKLDRTDARFANAVDACARLMAGLSCYCTMDKGEWMW